MISLQIADVSLRESEQDPKSQMSFKEKLETAKLLEKLRVDIIEAGPIERAPVDEVFIRTLASTLENSILSVPVKLEKQAIDRTWAALSKARRPRLVISVPASVVQMEYGQGMRPETVLGLVKEHTAYCSALCRDVEFVAVDSTRSEPGFLADLLKAAIDSGAKTVTLCDYTGESLPEEILGFISSVYAAVPQLRDVALSLHFLDNLGLASAAALAGIKSGARMVKASASDIRGTLSLMGFLNIVNIRGETLDIKCNTDATAMRRTCKQLAALAGAGAPRRGEPAETENASGEGGLPDGADAATLRSYIGALGYSVTEEEHERIFAQYQEIARSKKVVERDIEALVAETAGQAPAIYKLRNYVINSGSRIAATAHVEIEKDGTCRSALSAGDGPIDAAFKAAEQIIGGHYELEEFHIQAVTAGREATGDALIKLRHQGKLFSGRGVSTDIVGASMRAYLSAANKILHDAASSNSEFGLRNAE